MRLTLPLICMLAMVSATAQTTQPAAPSAAALELRATEAFNAGDYVAALPVLRQLEKQLQDQPDKLERIREQIRVADRNIREGIAAGTIQEDTSNDPPSAPETRKPHEPLKDGETREVLIKELGNFEYDSEVGGNVPKDVAALNGARIRVRGFMIPMDQAESITQFALVPSLFACCFGQPPQIQHTIIVNCPRGKAVSYYPDEIQVEGTLKVEEKKEDGFIISLFEMEGQSVKPVAK